jgi:hypothetical protein
MFETKVLQEIKTQALCSISFFSFENRAVYEIIWKHFVALDRQQMAWYTRIACRIPKATNTHTQVV